MKGYIKRLAKWLVKGIPEKHVHVTAGQLSYGHAMEGKSVLITGGNSGIGLCTAKKCLSEGAKVLIIGRNEEKNKAACDELGTNAGYITFDLSDTEKIPAMMDEACARLGKIDYCVCNAGISQGIHSFNDVTPEIWQNIMNIHFKGAYFTAREYIIRKKDGEEGSLVFTSSDWSFLSGGADWPYGIAKGAINSMTMGMSTGFYHKGIRVNAVAPGITATPMTRVSPDENMYSDRKCGRKFLPEEVAEVIFFLLSDASKCISGLVIPTDGGDFHR